MKIRKVFGNQNRSMPHSSVQFPFYHKVRFTCLQRHRQLLWIQHECSIWWSFFAKTCDEDCFEIKRVLNIAVCKFSSPFRPTPFECLTDVPTCLNDFLTTRYLDLGVKTLYVTTTTVRNSVKTVTVNNSNVTMSRYLLNDGRRRRWKVPFGRLVAAAGMPASPKCLFRGEDTFRYIQQKDKKYICM
jgi:hypothetical protein